KSDKELLQGTRVEESRGAGDGDKVLESDRWRVVFELGGAVAWLGRRTLAAAQGDPPRGRPAAAAPGGAHATQGQTGHELLQGTWVEQSRGAGDGEQVPENARWKLVFEGDKVTWLDRGKEREGTYTLDPERQPKEIDLTLASPTLVLTGIYEVKDGRLTTL